MKKAGDPSTTPLRMGGTLLVNLSHGAYSSIATAIKEYVSNAWDAGADEIHVRVYNPTKPARIVIEVLDNGCGMTRRDLDEKFFRVGRDRRREEGAKVKTIRGSRFVHGRKGLGKLAGLKMANVLDVQSWTPGSLQGARLSLNEVRQDPNREPLVHWYSPDRKPARYKSGTLITLREYSRTPPIDMAEVEHHLCLWFEFGSRATVTLESRSGDPAASRTDASWNVARREVFKKLKVKKERLTVAWNDGGRIVRHRVDVRWGWLEEGDTTVRSMISVFSGTRALSTEEDFDISRGWTNMFGIYKLVAEFHADWLDQMPDTDPADIKREGIDWHVHPAMQGFRMAGEAWVKTTCAKMAGSPRGEAEIRQKTERIVERHPRLGRWPEGQKRQLVRLVTSYASKMALATDQLSKLIDLFGFVLEHGALINFIEDLRQSGKKDIEGFLEHATVFTATEMTGLLAVTRSKLQLVKELRRIIQDKATTEVPREGKTDITGFLARSPWVFDPELRIDHVDHTMKRIVLETEGEGPATLNRIPTDYFEIRPDFVGYSGPTGRAICIELKKPGWEMKEKEAVRVIKYRAALHKTATYRNIRILAVSGKFSGSARAILEDAGVELLHYGDLLRRGQSQLQEFIDKLQRGLDRIEAAAAPRGKQDASSESGGKKRAGRLGRKDHVQARPER